jgi:hypothetical protein
MDNFEHECLCQFIKPRTLDSTIRVKMWYMYVIVTDSNWSDK